MRLFTDTKGTQWRLDVTAGVLMDIQTEMGLNLLDDHEQIPDDVRKIVGMLWITCMEQAQELKIGPAEFGRRLGGKVLQEALDAWMKEYADFFAHLSPARGRVIMSLWDNANKIEQAKDQVIQRVLSSTSTDFRELLDKIQGG